MYLTLLDSSVFSCVPCYMGAHCVHQWLISRFLTPQIKLKQTSAKALKKHSNSSAFLTALIMTFGE